MIYELRDLNSISPLFPKIKDARESATKRRIFARRLFRTIAETKMKDFPLHGLLPKAQTQALSFQESLGARGEGTRVAILDTGVDPGAPGLLKTPQGSQKLVAIIDCTGTGDVTCQEPQELSPEKTLAGVSGRKLVLNAAWPKPPTGRYFVGLKNTSDLFPGSLVERLKKVFIALKSLAVKEKLSSMTGNSEILRDCTSLARDSGDHGCRILERRERSQGGGEIQGSRETVGGRAQEPSERSRRATQGIPRRASGA